VTGTILDIHESRKTGAAPEPTTVQWPSASSPRPCGRWTTSRKASTSRYLPHEYVLKIAKPWLGKLVSVQSDWTPLKHYTNAFKATNNPYIDRKDPWQFKNFLITDGIDKGFRQDHTRETGGKRQLITKKQMQDLARKHGTPLFIVDHDEIRRNYTQVQEIPAARAGLLRVKAEPMPEIVRTLYKAGASFDVASMPEFMIVHENIKGMPDKKRLTGSGTDHLRQPDKTNETLRELDPYRRWSRSTTWRKSIRSRNTPPRRSVACASGCPTRRGGGTVL